MSAGINDIEICISSAVGSFIKDVAQDSNFRKVVKSKKTLRLGINSSFLYRDKNHVKTTKSNTCLIPTVNITDKAVRIKRIDVAKDLSIMTHYKILEADRNQETWSLTKAVEIALGELGELVFILIGKSEGEQPVEILLRGGPITTIQFDPTAGKDLSLSDGICTLGVPLPVDMVLSQIEEILGNTGQFGDSDRQKVAKAYDELLNQITTVVSLPTGGVNNLEDTLLGKMVLALEEQHNAYKRALEKLAKNRSDKAALNEVLRIAYNFVTDVQPLIFLLMSICDLKPVVFWCTIDKHWALHRAFSKLPWSALGKKEKIAEYQDIISAARNRAFHHFLPFDNTVEINLEKVNIQAEKLFLFPLYRQKERRGIQLKDQAIIDLFTQFSRAKERPVSYEFWARNCEVLECTCQLVRSTNDALIMLNKLKFRQKQKE